MPAFAPVVSCCEGRGAKGSVGAVDVGAGSALSVGEPIGPAAPGSFEVGGLEGEAVGTEAGGAPPMEVLVDVAGSCVFVVPPFPFPFLPPSPVFTPTLSHTPLITLSAACLSAALHRFSTHVDARDMMFDFPLRTRQSVGTAPAGCFRGWPDAVPPV